MTQRQNLTVYKYARELDRTYCSRFKPSGTGVADPANHAGTSIVTIPAPGAPYGPQVVMRRGIAFAAAGDKTGAYICMGHVSSAHPCSTMML